MKLDDYLRHSVIPQIQISSTYFKPDIPKDKLANAVRSYASGVGMSCVVVLVDETFWGSAEEGMLITNEKIYLSKKLGGCVIDLSAVNEISIEDKYLIVNDSPVTRFGNPEVMPLIALGRVLNQFVVASRKSTDAHLGEELDRLTTEKIVSFLATFSAPRFFDSAPTAHRKSGATTPGFALADSLTNEQLRLVRFKGQFAPNEELLCVSWLDTADTKDYFFCVSTYGVRSVTPSHPITFISLGNLCNLSVVEEYKQSRYVGLRLSNGNEVIVSIQNVYVRPYALELFTGLIEILRGQKPSYRPSPIASQPSASAVALGDTELTGYLGHGDATADLLRAAYAVMEKQFIENFDTSERREWQLLLSGFRDVYALATSTGTRRKLWPAGSPPVEEALPIHALLAACLYTHGMQSLPANFRSGMGDAWLMMIALPEIAREAIEAICEREKIKFQINENEVIIFQLLTSNLAMSGSRGDKFMDRLLAKGFKDPSELAVHLFELMNISAGVTRDLLAQASGIVKAWYQRVLLEVASGRIG